MLLFLQCSKAQEVWSLEKCIAHAQANSSSVVQSKNVVKDADLVRNGSKYQALPTLNGSSSYGLNFGRSVNPSTYQYDNINTNYNGGKIGYAVKQGESDILAAKADLQQTQNTIALQVAQAYLQILLNEEQLANAKRRAQQDVATLDKIEKQIKAGSLPATSRLDGQVTVAKS